MSLGPDIYDRDDSASPDGSHLDDAAFESFFRSTFVECCAYCHYQFGFDHDMAKEAVHSAFIKLWTARDIAPAGAGLKSYFKKIITNTCLDMLKHEKVRKRYEQFVLNRHAVAKPGNDYHIGDFRNLQSAINDAVAELPDQMRRIFEMSRYEELRYAEIAQKLNISVKTVETQVSRALSKLRKKLSDYLILFGSFLFMHP